LLTTNLNEEKAADKKLSTLALRKGVNRRAEIRGRSPQAAVQVRNREPSIARMRCPKAVSELRGE